MIALVILLFVAAFLLVLFDMRRGTRRPARTGQVARQRPASASARKRGGKR